MCEGSSPQKETEHSAIPKTARATSTSPSSVSSHLPGMYPASNAYDPFHCTIVGVEAGTHELLRHTFFSLARANFLAEAFAPDPKRLLAGNPSHQYSCRHHNIFSGRLQQCIEDKLLMYATLAYSSSMLAWTTGQFGHRQPPEFYIAKAIPELRARLGFQSNQVDNWLLLSLYSLAITELWNGLPLVWGANAERQAMVARMAANSLSASQVHLRALMHLVAQAGGWHLFDPYILDSYLLADKNLAIASFQPPMLLPSSCDPGSMPQRMKVGIGRLTPLRYPLLGTRLLQGPLAAGLKTILRDLVEFCRTADELWSQSDLSDPETEAWLFRRSQAIQYRLLLESHDCQAHHRDRCTSLAALIFICLAIPGGGPTMAARYLAHSLRTTIKSGPATKSRGEPPQLRLWWVFMGSLVPAPLEDDGPWFKSRLQQQSVGCVSLSSSMEEYLFLPARQGHLLHREYKY